MRQRQRSGGSAGLSRQWNRQQGPTKLPPLSVLSRIPHTCGPTYSSHPPRAVRYPNFHCFPGKKSVAQRSQGTSSRSPSCGLGAGFSASQQGSAQHAGRGTEKKMGRLMLESNGDRTEAEGGSRCIPSWGRTPPPPRPKDRSPSWLKAGAPSWLPFPRPTHPATHKCRSRGSCPPGPWFCWRSSFLLGDWFPSTLPACGTSCPPG